MCIRVLVSDANACFYGFSTSQCWPLDIFSPSHHELFKKNHNLIHLSFSEIGLCAFPWKCQAMVPLCIHYHVSSLKSRAADCSFNVDWLKGRSDVLSGLLVWFCHGTDRKHPEPVKYLVYKIRMRCWYPWFHLTMDHRFSSTWETGAFTPTSLLDTPIAYGPCNGCTSLHSVIRCSDRCKIVLKLLDRTLVRYYAMQSSQI